MKKNRSLKNNEKIPRLAEAIRLAVRAYENGKQDTSLKLIGLVVSQLEHAEERKALHRLVEADVKRSEVWHQYHALLFQRERAHGAGDGRSECTEKDAVDGIQQESASARERFWNLWRPRQKDPFLASRPPVTLKKRRSFL